MQRIQILRDTILRAKHAYYYGATPIMSDAQYDALEDELKALSPNDQVLAIVGSPVPVGSMLEKAEHSMPMGSQEKLNSEAEFRTWCAKNDVECINAGLKGDGGSAAAYYVDGQMKQCISRGDGLIGEDITGNAMKFASLPAWTGTGGVGFTGSVRFECILTIAQWAKVDPEMSTNPRNLGNGVMGRKDGSESEFLSAFAFDIDEMRDGERVQWKTETQKMERLTELGFNVLENQTFDSVDEAVAFFNDVASRRSKLPYWIDGVVMKVDDVAKQLALGVTGGRPKGQTAWKFENVGYETVLEAVTISGGHHGGLYPTAQFKPVAIAGTMVTSASLSNFDEVDRLGIAIGDTIMVTKANEIIPQVMRVVSRPENRQLIERPTCCPFCKGDVGYKKNTKGEKGVLLMCLNPECDQKSTGKIAKWIASTGILGIGDALLEALVDRFGVSDASDLYLLQDRKAELANLVVNGERDLKFGEKRTVTLLEAIDRKRTLSLDVFLGSLGIDGLGKRRVELIAKAVGGSLNTLQVWREGKLRDPEFAAQAGVPGLGKTIQDGIDNFSHVIDKMLSNGVVVNDLVQKEKVEGGKTLCISGKLNSGKKKADYADALKAVGIDLVDDVVKGLTYLVLADPESTSGKQKKAQKLGIPVLSEERMIELLAN